MANIFRKFIPEASSVSIREKLLSAFLAFISLLVCISVSALFVDVAQAPILIASTGAAAVLVFATPNAKVSQPWPLIGGHLVSSLIGVWCYQNIPDVILAVAIAGSSAIFFMYILRCLHPPGGAAALSVILGGSDVQAMGYEYVLFPVMANILLLFTMAMIVNNLAPGRRYPNEPAVKKTGNKEDWALGKTLFELDDLESALQEMDTYVDVSRAELAQIYQAAVQQANKRRLGEVLGRDIMSREVVTVEYGVDLEDVWKLLQENEIKAVPVVDRFDRVIGIVTVSDFVKHANVNDEKALGEKIRDLIKKTDGMTSDKPEVVGQIMTAPAVTVEDDMHVVELVSLFTEKNIHHLPVVDSKKYLVGMITRSDLMRAVSLIRM